MFSLNKSKGVLCLRVVYFVMLATIMYGSLGTASAKNNKTDSAEASGSKDINYLVPDTAKMNFTLIANRMSCALIDIPENDPSYLELQKIPVYSDSVIKLRLLSIQSNIPFVHNEYVKRWIEVYTVDKRYHVEQILGRSYLYYSLFDEIFSDYDLPLELKHLAVIESALDPNAVSCHGATGMWQFMYKTAEYLDLNMNAFYDERKDLFRSTDAAARYLKYLHGKYDDWLLAIAAYNGGPGTINKAIRRSGGKRTFWEIRPFLPRETRNYVPAFIAVNYLMTYSYEHNLMPRLPKSYVGPINSSTIDTINISQQVSFEVLASYLHMDEEELESLNPGFKKSYIPFLFGPYVLKIPCEKKVAFNALRDSIYQAEKQRLGYSEKIVYKVKYGDNLFLIAKRFGCEVVDIKEWNFLNSNMIYERQSLLLYIPTRNIEEPTEIKSTNNKTNKEFLETLQLSDTNNRKNYVFYKISPGDTLWDIASQYPDTTVEKLKELNNIIDERSLIPGRLIKIKNSE